MKNTFDTRSIKIRRSQERGHANHGWLDSYHTFSFAGYQDKNYMGFRALIVINEDQINPGMGFGPHSHEDMEIFTYVIEGALTHQDNMEHQSTINAGDVQKMTAGTGIVHSEFNASKKEKVHLLQIWILPAQKGLKPSYQEYSGLSGGTTPLSLIGSPRGGKNIIQFNQDFYVYKGKLTKGEKIRHELKPGRGAWLQIIKGALNVGGQTLFAGDGAAVENIDEIPINAAKDSEFLLMDLS